MARNLSPPTAGKMVSKVFKLLAIALYKLVVLWTRIERFRVPASAYLGRNRSGSLEGIVLDSAVGSLSRAPTAPSIFR